MGGTLAQDDAVADLGGAAAMNNTWGRGAAAGPYMQRIDHGESLADGLRMVWAWPPGDGPVLGFPELYVGRRPWPELPPGGDFAGLRVSETEGLTARWAVDWGGATEKFNLAFDLWITDAPGGAIRQEVMVWVKRGGFPSSGEVVGELTVGGLSGPLYVHEGHGNAPGESWTYHAWLPRVGEGLKAGELDLGALLGALAAQGRVDAEGWLTSIEFGPEITGGSGWLAVTEFAVVQGAGAPAKTGEAQVLHPPPAPPAHP